MAGSAIALVILALYYYISSSDALNCSIPPVYVDIHLRAVNGTPDENVFQYGSFVGVGSPAQNQSIWPSLRQNETTFALKGFCQSSKLANCDFSTGGFVDPSMSTR
jgi:hypothetical protein